MKKVSFTDVIFSSLFFILALFTLLTLFLSSFVEDFRQLFRLVTKPYGVYYGICITLLFAGVALSAINFFRLLKGNSQKIYSLLALFMLFVFLGGLYYELFLHDRNYYDPFSLEDTLHFIQDNVNTKIPLQRIVDYSYYIIFIIFPAIIYMFNLKFNKSSLIGKVLAITTPNINLVLCVLFGFSIFPYFKDIFADTFDLTLILLGLVFFGYIHTKKRYLVDSYEYFNLLLLLILITILVFANYFFVNNESYFEMRKTFYYLALFSWCNDWMNKINTNNL